MGELLNAHGVNDVRQIEMHTVKPLVLEPSSFKVKTAIEKLTICKSPGTDQILAEQIQIRDNASLFQIHKLINYIWNKE
jgi:hypothetical protein